MAKRTSAYVSQLVDAPATVGRQIGGWLAEFGRATFPSDRFFAIYRFGLGLEAQLTEAMGFAADILPEVQVESRNRTLSEADLQVYLEAVAALRAGAFAAMPKTALQDDPNGDLYALGHIGLDAVGKPVIRQAASADAAALLPLLAAVQAAAGKFSAAAAEPRP